MAAVVATATPAVVTAFISFARIVSFLGDPYAMNTPEGYITFRYMATTLPLLLSIWPILAGARLVRGEEERGTMDVLLATSQSRTRLLLEKVGALAIALLVIAVLFAVGVVAGEAALGGGHRRFCQGIACGAEFEPAGLLLWYGGAVALSIDDWPPRGSRFGRRPTDPVRAPEYGRTGTERRLGTVSLAGLLLQSQPAAACRFP